MGYAGKIDLKIKAIELRKRGFSVREIQKRLKISKSSASLWVRDVVLTKAQIKKLYLNKKSGNLKGSFIAANNKRRKREELTKYLKNQGEKEVGILTRRDRFIAGVAMYFAEGSKRDGGVQFCNSDPRAIEFIMSWLREFASIPNEKFRGALYIHNNLNEKVAKDFWSRLTHIPLDQFTKTYKVSNNPNRLRKTKHAYGIFRVTINDVILHRKIMGWIEGLLK